MHHSRGIGKHMRMGFLGAAALVLLTAACGSSQEQRSASGGLTGLGVGAVVGGPIGAVVGAAAGAAGGLLMPEGADTVAENLLGREHHATAALLPGGPTASGANTAAATATAPNPAAASGTSAPPGLIKQAQTELRNEGLYHARIDGILGPKTRDALKTYQQRQGLTETGALDQATAQRMNLVAQGMPPAPPSQTGSSAPPPPPPPSR